MNKGIVAILLFLGYIPLAFGQTYPVSLSARVGKPYSIYLADYAQFSSGAERLAATLLLRDANEAFYDVRLRVTIKGVGIQIESKPDFVVAPVTLQTGLPLTLQNEDFSAYLNPQNLVFQGITRQQFEQTSALPEGLYEISWQVYDARRTEVSLSSIATTTAWIMLNNPPLINTPLAAEKLTPRDPQNVRFSWQPGGALLNGGFTTEYRLELYEMRAEGRDPNEIVRGTQPVATLTTSGNALTYDASQLTLIPGMRYAFRVQARDTEGRALYKNSGYSEVRTFIYGDACLPPTEVTVTDRSTQWVTLAWQPASTTTQYVLRYRQAGDPDAQWFEDKTYTVSRRLSGLRPGNTYEYQVKSQCGSFGSTYAPTGTFTTVGAEEADLTIACSPTALPPPALDASTALPLAHPGSFFKVGHFDMKVTEVSGGAGVFSGRGEIFVPFLATTLKVSFRSLGVNREGQVISGTVTADFVDEQSLSVSTINRINGYETAFSEICVDYNDGYDQDGFDENGLDREGYDREGYNEAGFNRDGRDRGGYDQQGLDENGIDREGYGEGGFDQDGIDRTGRDRDGNLVDPTRGGAMNQAATGGTDAMHRVSTVSDNDLEKTIKSHLKEQDKINRNLIKDQRKAVVSLSQTLEESITDAIAKKIFSNRALIVGSDERAIGEGMSKRITITQEPAPDYPYYNVPRAHKDLYDADVLLQTSLAKQITIEQYQDDLTTATSNVRTRLDAFTEEEAASLENEAARESWIQQQVDELVEAATAPEAKTLHDNVIPDEANRRSGIPFNSNERAPEAYVTLSTTFRPQISPNVNRSFQLNQIIQDENRKRGQYAVDEAQSLPIGIGRVVGNTEFVIAIGTITFSPVAAHMDVYMGTEMPRSGNWLSFQAQAVELFPEGFGGETNRLLLADDVPVRLSNSARLTLKGTEQRTFVEWDCQGFRQLGVQGEVEFCPGVIRPALDRAALDRAAPDGAATSTTLKTASTNETETVKARFETTFTDWDEFIVAISLDPFEVRGLNDFVFTVNQAYLDFSDAQNPAGMMFPEGYRSSYAEAGVATLWQGFYLRQAKVKLPSKLADTSKEKPKDLYVENLIIDDQGVSGIFSAEGIIPDGSLGGWGYSVDQLSVHLIKNQLKGAELQGGVQLPIMEDTIGYRAQIQTNGQWLFGVRLPEATKVPLLVADVHLSQASTIIVEEQDDKLAARALLSGTAAINTPLLSNSVVRLSGLDFEGMILDTEVPHFEPGVWSLGEAGVGNAAAGFELTLTDVGLETVGENEVALRMGARVDLAKAIVGTTNLRIIGEQTTDFETGRQQWQHRETILNEISLSTQGGPIGLTGSLHLFDAHPVYGKGFRGAVQAEFSDLVTVDAQAMFGRVDGTRYWYADALVRAGEIPLAGTGLSIYGFGGGAYHRMRRERVEAVRLSAEGGRPADDGFTTPSGIRYVPDVTAGLGVKAAVAFGTSGNAKPFNGDVGFEMAFNRGGGVRTFGFTGNGYFMSDLEVGKPRGATSLYAGVDLLYDFQNRELHGTCDVYASVAGGLIRGRNPGNLAGQAVLHFDPNNWYIHIGRPSSRVGLMMTTPIKALPIKVDMGAYFMVGTQLEDMPSLPDNVSSTISYQAEREEGAMLEGKGFAFGADFSINTGKLQAAIFYGELSAGAGFDVMLMNRDNMMCAGRQGKPGINGWYAEGQAYAYLEGAIGIRVKVFKLELEEEILRVGAGAVLQAKLPNPFWMSGGVRGYYSLLGGRVQGQCNFDFELGEQCQWHAIDDPEESSPVDGLSVIATLTPEAGKSEVDVFVAPQAVFNLPINEPFVLVDTLGDQQPQFRVALEKFEVLHHGKPVTGAYEWNDRHDVVAFDAHEILPGQQELTALVRVRFEELRHGRWETVTVNGQDAVEEMQHVFTTAAAPTSIPEENVVYSYPVNRQMHFLPQEYADGGYVQLEAGQDYLFTPDPKWRTTGRLTPVGGAAAEFDFAYHPGDKRLAMSLPSNLRPEQIYRLEVVKLPAGAAEQVDQNVSQATRTQTQGGQEVSITTNEAEGGIERLEEQVIYTNYFRTSQHRTFAEKYAALTWVNDWQWALQTGVQELGRTVTGPERFDAFEMEGKGEMRPLVQFSAGQTEDWHKEINALVYDNAAPINPTLPIGWNGRPTHLGMPPIEAVILDQTDENIRLTDAMISSGTATGGSGKVTHVYQLPFYMYYDYFYLQQRAANSGLDGEGIRHLLRTPFMPIYSGEYPVSVGYQLPGEAEMKSRQEFKITKP